MGTALSWHLRRQTPSATRPTVMVAYQADGAALDTTTGRFQPVAPSISSTGAGYASSSAFVWRAIPAVERRHGRPWAPTEPTAKARALGSSLRARPPGP